MWRRRLAYSLLAASFFAAVLLKGGVYARQWEWSALGISIAALLLPPKPGRLPLFLTLALAAWMILAIVPLPPSLIAAVAPPRFEAVTAAHAATHAAASWTPLSIAPPATLERLLNVLPALAIFLMGSCWSGRLWIAFAPVVLIAWLESLLGLVQFHLGRAGKAFPSGTYVYHNHFAGLLEIALPLAALCALWLWRNRRPAQAAAMTAIALCLLMGILVSLSRMGLVSTLAAALIAILFIAPARVPATSRLLTARLLMSTHAGKIALRAAALTIIPLALLLIAPKELVARFQQLASEPALQQDDRAQIWRDTTKLIAASPWTGTGLGAYEHGLFRHKTALPDNAVDFAHNDYLQILAELGIPGFSLALTLAAWILWTALSRARRPADPQWELSIGLLAALVALAIHSLADFNLYLPSNALALAWTAGLAVRN